MDPVLDLFHKPVRIWFREHLGSPTRVQELGWPAIRRGEHALLLAPTGSGKTLAAFLSAIDTLMFEPVPARDGRCRVLYISPLKALAVDVERNLRAPLAGAALIAERLGIPIHVPASAIRTGDTPPRERAQFARNPSDILITTPESLYLLLLSRARESLRSIRWVIVDEIHTMVATKRGAHLALSLERLAELAATPFQRIGLSATQRPPEEAARFLGGQAQPVTVVDAGSTRPLDVLVTVPVEDMSELAKSEHVSGPAWQGTSSRSIWPSIHPQILALIRSHRTTLIFVNSRRLAERMAAALNELAGEELVRAHHGSVSRQQRSQIEDDLKAGRLSALVATSSLELGIDMGSIDLVVQVESPPSVASGLQRIGRSGHQAGASSKGIIFPKYRGDLLACAALADQMLQGNVEELRYPRNPLDVLAQQIVAMVSMDAWMVDDLERVIHRAAPFSDLTRGVLENVLDMLSGRYPSDQFSDLRPRVVWDRIAGSLRAREGAKRIAIANGGTIPDRGLYGVFVAGAKAPQGRVGELDEEMVFETRTGETFLLGATAWRVEEITNDRVLVSPAPGEPAKMPFWRGDSVGRPVEFGRAMGRLIRAVRELDPAGAEALLQQRHRLDPRAAKNLLGYLREQAEATGVVPDDRTIVLERYVDDFGDWKVCLLSLFGGRVHAPWTHAIDAMLRQRFDLEIETLWSDDGIVVRFPESNEPPPVELLLPDPDTVEALVLDQLGTGALFAGHFREAASRALLLPRRFPGRRLPLWQQRKRAGELLEVASRYRDFPILLETYRELLRDVFDMPALVGLLRDIQNRTIRVVTVDTRSASPFASSLLFGYVGNFVYDGDAPRAERRAQVLSIDQAQLRELLGETDLRDLLDPSAVASLELELQRLDPDRRVKHLDGLHDLLLRVGDLSQAEASARCVRARSSPGWLEDLRRQRRAVEVAVAGESRWIAAEDTARYRDALGVPPPAGLPAAFLQPVDDPLQDLIARYARTHGPFAARDPAGRFRLGPAVVERTLAGLRAQGRVVEGQFRPGGSGAEWCDAGVLRTLRQKTLALLRHQIEPVEPAAYGRLLPEWHRLGSAREGNAGLLDVIGQLQGYPLPASVLETQVLPARLKHYDWRDLDSLLASGLVVWCGVEALGQSDGYVALYLAEHVRTLLRQPRSEAATGDMHHGIRQHLLKAGASFFPQILAGVGGGYRREVIEALWDMVWTGEVTNDTLAPLRARLGQNEARRRRDNQPGKIPARATLPGEASGRWWLVESLLERQPNPTERLTATARQLLERSGVLTREAIAAERITGGFSALYPVLKALEEAGRIRRGYFISGRGAAQFADPGALERLRSLRESADKPLTYVLAATDPANPYGAALSWPARADNRSVGRFAGALVILVDGSLAAYLGKGERTLLTFLREEDPAAEWVSRAIAEALADLVVSGRRRAVWITEIDGKPPGKSALAGALEQHGFRAGSQGWQRRATSMPEPPP
ncbi:MAG: DEAD/DEAH box helicase [Acidobacteriota bacterium]